MVPNIIYAIKNKDGKNLCTNKVVNILEQVGRYTTMFLMVFNVDHQPLYWDARIKVPAFAPITRHLVFAIESKIRFLHYHPILYCHYILLDHKKLNI